MPSQSGFLAERMAQKMKNISFTDNLGLKDHGGFILRRSCCQAVFVNLDNP